MKKLLTLSLAICLSSSSFALNWQMVGARSMAMGGAGVVIASGTNAQYYNPALLGEATGDEKTDENGFHFGIQTETPKLKDEHPASSGHSMSYLKDLLKKGYVPLTNTDIGFGIRRGNFAFSIRSLDTMSMRRIQQRFALANMAAFNEAAIGYGFYLVEGLRLGGNLKVIQGTALETAFDWSTSETGFGSFMRDAWHNRKLSADWGVDLGAAINLSDFFQGNFIFNPDIGLTVRNLNTPKFKRPKRPAGWGNTWDSNDYKLKPQYRLGAAIHPVSDRLTIAADIDLNKNETTIEGYKSQQLSAGMEILVWNEHSLKVPLRLGVNKNLAEDEAPTYITGGFGTIGHDFDFELGLSCGDRTNKVKSWHLPSALGLSMSFAWYF